MPLDDFIIHIYLFVDDYFKGLSRLRQRGPSPRLSDEEVITLEIVGEYLGLGSDKRIYEYFCRHWTSWFPHLGCRTTFVRQSANLWRVKQEIQQFLVQQSQGEQNIWLFDGFPIPTLHLKRYKRSRTSLTAQGEVGYCASKEEKYFGFKGHIVTTDQGLIVDYTLTPANCDERDVVPEVTQGKQGHLIADKGLIRPQLRHVLADQGLALHTPLRRNMKDARSKAFVTRMMTIRRRIETVISQLTQRLNIQTIRAKDMWHLTSKLARKILCHTFCFFIAKSLRFDHIIKS